MFEAVARNQASHKSAQTFRNSDSEDEGENEKEEDSKVVDAAVLGGMVVWIQEGTLMHGYIPARIIV